MPIMEEIEGGGGPAGCHNAAIPRAHSTERAMDDEASVSGAGRGAGAGARARRG